MSRAAQTPTVTSDSHRPSSRLGLPTVGACNPSSDRAGTSPGSFANAPDIGGPRAFSSPDTPGMPAPSDKTAWDFLPDGWTVEIINKSEPGGTGVPPVQSSSASGAGVSPVLPGVARLSEPCAEHKSNSESNCCSADTGRSATEAGLGDCSRTGETPVPLGTVESIFTDARGVTRRVTFPADFQPITQLEFARLGVVTDAMRHVATREPHLTAEQIRDEIAAGRMILPWNTVHRTYNLEPMVIGRASLTKVNANMGASPVSSGTAEEVEKLRWAERWGADTVMDLSTGGDLDACRDAIIRASRVPIGTVPIYSMIIGRRLEDLTYDIILDTIEHQAKQGVDYMTVHAGVRRAHLPFVRDRLIGIVSRGGSLLAKWMLVHDRENPMYELWDEICGILRRYDVAFSIGDGLRPGGLADATDDAQLAELETLGELTERAWRCGVQVMVEGPGHVPFDQIEYNMKLQRTLCHGAPFYVLGPLVTDIFPGYDHITSCIGATAAAYHGASMLCYVTPKEHLGLPKKDDVKQGCVAYKIAAHAADVALGIPHTRDRDDDLTRARAALNWEKHFELSFDPDTARALHDEDLDVDTDFCAMCGHDWCSVRISKEIQEFASGKADGFVRLGGKTGDVPNAPKIAAALTPEQQEILRQRGVLSPEEVHRLASKTRRAVGAEQGVKAACHSEIADDARAREVQAGAETPAVHAGP